MSANKNFGLKYFIGVTATLVICVSVLNLIGPARAVRANNSLIDDKVGYISETKPKIVFMGIPVCQEGINEEMISEIFGLVVNKHCGHIQRSAYYYFL